VHLAIDAQPPGEHQIALDAGGNADQAVYLAFRITTEHDGTLAVDEVTDTLAKSTNALVNLLRSTVTALI
jgi:hypothetical protein